MICHPMKQRTGLPSTCGCILVLSTLIALCAARLDAAADEPPPGDAARWPVFRGNAAGTGVALTKLPPALKVRWEYRVPEGAFEATPVVADGCVYIGDLDGQLYALDLHTGQPRWKKKFDLGFTAAAAVRDQQLLIGDMEGRLHSLDAATGNVQWTFATEVEISAGANFYRDQVLIGSQDGTLYCLQAATGQLAWKYSIDNQIRCAATVVEDRAFVAGCDGQLHIIDVTNGQLAGKVDIKAPTGVTPAAVGQHVYFGTEGGVFFCVDWKRAETVWTFEDRQRQQPVRSSPAVADGVVVFGGRSKKVYALNADNGQLQWEFTTRQRVDASPVIVQDRVFVAAADGRLYALELKTGKELWQFEAGGGFAGSPAVADQRLVIASQDGVVYCLGE